MQRMPNTEYPFGDIVSDNRDWFVFDRYWGNHSRVLQRMGGKFHESIEVSVTPINSDIPSSWERIKELRIRHHVTDQSDDRFTHVFCGGVAKCILDKVGAEFYETLFHTDLLSEIDWAKYQVVDLIHWQGGGIPLILICKDPKKFPHAAKHFVTLLEPDSYWDKLFGDEHLNPIREAAQC